MIFAKLDVCFWRHKRFMRAGPAAAGLWAAALAYLREDESVDGILEADVLGQLFSLGDREARKLCERLVEVGLFERAGDGYVLLRYAAKNETREEIESRRADTRTRVSTFRAKKRVGSGAHDVTSNEECNTVGNALQASPVTDLATRGVPGSDSDSDSVISEREPEREPDSTPASRPAATSQVRIRNATDDGAFGLSVDAWAEGVRSATRNPFVLPRGGSSELSKLVEAILAFAGTADRVGWARDAGAAYAKARAGEKLNAHGFLDWLNSGRPDRGARAGPQDVPNPHEGATVVAERRRRDAEFDEARRNAAPPPIGELMKAVGGKSK